jgi:hypothetical protein
MGPQPVVVHLKFNIIGDMSASWSVAQSGDICVICLAKPLPDQVLSYDGHTGNVMALGFQKDGKWMYSCESVHPEGMRGHWQSFRGHGLHVFCVAD